MPYTPNPDTATQPTDAVLAETATVEFQALKNKINTMLGLYNGGSPIYTGGGLYTLLEGQITTINSSLASYASSISVLNGQMTSLTTAYNTILTAAVLANATLNGATANISPTTLTLAGTTINNTATNTNFTGTNITIGSASSTVTLLGNVGSPSFSAFAPTNSPAFTGIPTAPTAAFGTSSTQLATTAFVAAMAFSSSLPAINAGTAGQFVTNNGVVGSWASMFNAVNSAVTLTAGINNVDASSGAIFNLTLPAAATTTLVNLIDVTGYCGVYPPTLASQGGATIGSLPSPMTLDLAGFDFWLEYNATANDWRIV